MRRKTLINELLSKHTNQPLERIAAESERDKWMSPEEARDYGLIDEVLYEEQEKPKTKDKPEGS